MADRTNATPTTTTAAGILRPEELASYAVLERTPCADALTPWVENHWTLTWDLPPGRSFVSQTLPHPTCTLSVELGHPRTGVGSERVLVTGVQTRRFDVTIAQSGWVHGVKFRPGGLAALSGCDAASLADRTVPAADVLPASVVTALRSLESRTGFDTTATAAARLVGDALLEVAPAAPDPSYDLVLALVADMLADRDLLRVADLQERHGLGRRRIERLFARYVGATPKWVLARHRMHDVVTTLDEGHTGSLAELAARYGWYDQAHFTRDFTRLVGVAPGEYRDRR